MISSLTSSQLICLDLQAATKEQLFIELAGLLNQQGYLKVHRIFPGKAALIFRKKYSESRNP